MTMTEARHLLDAYASALVWEGSSIPVSHFSGVSLAQASRRSSGACQEGLGSSHSTNRLSNSANSSGLIPSLLNPSISVSTIVQKMVLNTDSAMKDKVAFNNGYESPILYNQRGNTPWDVLSG